MLTRSIALCYVLRMGEGNLKKWFLTSTDSQTSLAYCFEFGDKETDTVKHPQQAHFLLKCPGKTKNRFEGKLLSPLQSICPQSLLCKPLKQPSSWGFLIYGYGPIGSTDGLQLIYEPSPPNNNCKYVHIFWEQDLWRSSNSQRGLRPRTRKTPLQP